MGRHGKRLLPFLRWGTVAVLLALLLLDAAFPLPLPKGRDAATVVTARDGSPLRAFADARGVWRYPATPEQVSPLYVQALLGYEDRWFWRHPGVLITPHVAAQTQLPEAVAQISRNLRALAAGTALTGVVERTRAY